MLVNLELRSGHRTEKSQFSFQFQRRAKPKIVQATVQLNSLKTKQNKQTNKKTWKILKNMGVPDHFTCFLRNLYTSQGATVKTRHGTMDLFKTGK